MTWDYKQYPKGHFDFVWGSPACTHFSIARTTGGPRDLEGACALVAKTLEIMAYFECPWALENPATGYLKKQPLMQGLPWDDITYCAYGFGYRKKLAYGTHWEKPGIHGHHVARPRLAPLSQ